MDPHPSTEASPRRSRRHAPAAALGLILAMAAAGAAMSEIYRYQDADGTWHFSDRPPPDQRFDAVPEAYAKQQGPAEDLAAQLAQAFPPHSPIERATLAVVAVRHGLGEGSGFFVSENGYILTNRHVVRPTEFGQWQEAQDKLVGEEAELTRLADEHEDLKRQLAAMDDDLARAEELVGAAHPAQQAEAQERYERMRSSYQYRRKRLAKAQDILKERERAFRRAKLEFDWQSTASSMQNSFQVVLKDETELTAFLVDTSDDLDLALLKLDGHRTPAIRPAGGGWLGQGETVFAVGNPIGMADATTSGVITTLRDGKIVTDAQILPGNSGGPLLNQEGEVIGVNVSKLSGGDSVYNQGFGMAIPIGVAIRQFPELHGLPMPK
jgi:S1-C subfamily serine protease